MIEFDDVTGQNGHIDMTFIQFGGERKFSFVLSNSSTYKVS